MILPFRNSAGPHYPSGKVCLNAKPSGLKSLDFEKVAPLPSLPGSQTEKDTDIYYIYDEILARKAMGWSVSGAMAIAIAVLSNLRSFERIVLNYTT